MAAAVVARRVAAARTGGTPVIIVGGYDSALNYMRTNYGAVIVHDAVLNADLIQLPGREDPIGFFFTVLTTDTFRGYPLYRFFQMVEVTSVGDFGEPDVAAAKTNKKPFDLPNDPLYRLQWNLEKARLDVAQWHPVSPQRRAKVAIIDSGIEPGQRSHDGLDGTNVRYVSVAPSTGHPTLHGLELATMMADRGQEGDGIAGLMGRWGNGNCFPERPIYASLTPEVFVYNVGDFGPISLYVARAIQMATAEGVDVINLSLHTAPSSVVENAIRAAQRAGVIVVAAAGNYETKAKDKVARFPANVAGVISVGAAGENMKASDFSATEGVDIYAPGENIVVGGRSGAWVYGDGTSFAVPHVVATIALMRTANPGVTQTQALDAIQRYAITNGNRNFLNALSALNAVLPERDRARNANVTQACTPSGGFGKDAEANDDGYVYDDHIDDDLFPARSQASTMGLETGLSVAPNPARGAARVALTLGEAQHVRVAVYDALGREVALLADGPMNAGLHQLPLNGAGLGAGTYVVRMVTEHGAFTRTLALLN